MGLRGALRRRLAAHPVAAFLILAFGWTWGWVLAAALTRAGRLDLPMRGDLGVLLARFGPSLAALALLGLSQGTSAVRALLGRLGAVRVGAGWVVLALGMDIPLYLATFGLGALLDPHVPSLQGSVMSTLVATWIPTFIASFLTSGLGEELGWRGLLLPLLLRRLRPLPATLLMVPIVSLWHLNAGILARGLTEGWPAFLAAYLPAMAGRLALTAPSLCVFTLLFLRGRGSLLLMAAAHAAINASFEWADACLPTKPPLFWGLYGGLLTCVGLWAAVRLARLPEDLELDPAYRYFTEQP